MDDEVCEMCAHYAFQRDVFAVVASKLYEALDVQIMFTVNADQKKYETQIAKDAKHLYEQLVQDVVEFETEDE